jgi:hypothetical protein
MIKSSIKGFTEKPIRGTDGQKRKLYYDNKPIGEFRWNSYWYMASDLKLYDKEQEKWFNDFISNYKSLFYGQYKDKFSDLICDIHDLSLYAKIYEEYSKKLNTQHIYIIINDLNLKVSGDRINPKYVKGVDYLEFNSPEDFIIK